MHCVLRHNYESTTNWRLKMDRSDEFLRIVSIYTQPGVQPSSIPQASLYVKLAGQVSAILDTNGTLLERMVVLADRKEFSNDPTVAISEISEQFEFGVARVQAEVARMQSMTESAKEAPLSSQQQQHRKLLKEGLLKRMKEHLESFQSAIKTHTAHVQARNGRVGRYGASSTISTNISAGLPSVLNSTGNFAMFQAPSRLVIAQASPLKANVASGTALKSHSLPASTETFSAAKDGTNPAVGVHKAEGGISTTHLDAELRKRGNVPAPSVALIPQQAPAGKPTYTQRRSATNYDGSAYDAYGPRGQQNAQDDSQAKGAKLQHARGLNSVRLRGAEKVEAALAQMGSLFTQMAGLVMEQGETLARIEDDIESGLEQTVAAHKEMEYFYEISKGNRGLIIKIFCLLIFFAVLFLKLW